MKLEDTEVYKHSVETRNLALMLTQEKVAEWLLTVGYYPEAYVLPPFFTVSKFTQTRGYFEKKTPRNKKNHKLKKLEASEHTNVSYPSDGFTSRTFSILDPRHYHDLVAVISKNYVRFVGSYEAKRIFSFTFPIPVDVNNPGNISAKRSERQIYEYIDAAEKRLLIDAADYKFVVIADIKQFYPSIYTHSISWALHTKKKIRDGNERNLRLIGNHIDTLVQYSNDRKTNGIAVGPAISDVISEWLLNVVDAKISSRLPGRAFGIRFKDDYRIVCDTEDEAKSIIGIIQKELKEYDLHLSDEKTSFELMPDGLYRPWMLEYDHFATTLLDNIAKNEPIPFRKYLILQRKVFDMNKSYAAKGVTEKFLGRLVGDDCSFMVSIGTKLQKQMVIANLFRLIGQKPKVIGQVLGILESLLDDESKMQIEDKLNNLWGNNRDNEFMLCWIYYFMKINNLKVKKVDPNMPLLYSMFKNKQKFYPKTPGNVNLITHFENIDTNISEHVALFKKELT